MRKNYKKKKRSCKMCKPHKMKGAKRWKPAEEASLRDFEKEAQDVTKNQKE